MNYNDDINYRISTVSFKARHNKGENGCSYLFLDHEEHPDLSQEDLKPLGIELIKAVEKYVEEKKKCEANLIIEGHSSSYHIIKNGFTIAKIWTSEMHNSDINKRPDAYRVAKELRDIIRKGEVPIVKPELKRLKCSDEYSYEIVDDQVTIAKFVRKSDAERYMAEMVYKKYGQAMKKGCGKLWLGTKNGNGTTIELFSGFGGFPMMQLDDVLYYLREYIHRHIEVE